MLDRPPCWVETTTCIATGASPLTDSPLPQQSNPVLFIFGALEREGEEEEACLLRAKLHFARNCCSRVVALPEPPLPFLSIASIAPTADARWLVECRSIRAYGKAVVV